MSEKKRTLSHLKRANQIISLAEGWVGLLLVQVLSRSTEKSFARLHMKKCSPVLTELLLVQQTCLQLAPCLCCSQTPLNFSFFPPLFSLKDVTGSVVFRPDEKTVQMGGFCDRSDGFQTWILCSPAALQRHRTVSLNNL